ncbi:MAG: ornithine carbamoyltransferase [Verrucomicrobiota bacterium]
MRHFLKINDFTSGDVEAVFEKAKDYKKNRGQAGTARPLEGQTWAMIFSKSSTRTRVSFQTGIYELGGLPMFLSAREIQLGRGEPIKDTARVLGRMVSGAVIRTYAQSEIEEFASYSKIPTINALTDDEHPCQILTDIFTFNEKRGSIRGKKVAFIGDAACNVARSFVHAAELLDFQLVCAAPEKYQTDVTNSHTQTTSNPREAAKDADLLYTDVWISMGKESESEDRIQEFQGYQLNHELKALANSDALVLHCLPAYRDKEISERLLEDCADDIFDQAENRLHIQKAIMDHLATSK